MTEAEKFIATVLGGEAAEMFATNMEDFTYYAKSVALTELDIPVESVRTRFESISLGILGESVKVFLENNYTDKDGRSSARIEGANVYDSNMNPIPAIGEIRSHKDEVVEEMLDWTMAEFDKGRRLARIIVARLGRNEKKLLAPPPRDYEASPPLEKFEIELMRLENALPDVTREQAKRMMELYSMLAGWGGRGRDE
jgi:hypothetical protein